MLFVLIALWAIAAILWLTDGRSDINRRLGAVAFSGGAGALAAVLDLSWIPAATEAGMSASGQQMLYYVQAVSSLTSYYGLPYFFLLFALAYHRVPMPLVLYKLVQWILILPILCCILFTPYYNEMYPITFKLVVWWAVPYILFGTVLILLKRQPYAALSRKHWIVCSAVLPPVLFSMLMNYVLPSMGMLRMWVYNTWFVGLGATVFVVGLFTYGFMGVRVLIDRRRFDTTYRAVTSGTAILNHAIKNDAAKMRLFSEKMKAYAIETNQAELLADIETVLSASKHMQDMVGRVHRRTEDLTLKPHRELITDVVVRTVKPIETLYPRASFQLALEEGWSGMIDSAQIGEALSNLVVNGLEAMKGEGELRIALSEQKRELVIEVRDSGAGMDKSQIAKAFEPFYTTKAGSSANFGLGLPYAFQVMRKHKGVLHVMSKPGQGTSVLMAFPKKAIQAVKTESLLKKGAEAHVVD
ncbi:ATP-binding protein [Paenibacillus sp. YIM B09110]|uniref:ATP-binding protein n=1 Tax=Paenibacillus sp. YIM B09110 TaxID=3126102 RepID=UPI00301DED0D